MAIITISRGCYSKGKEVAEKVAATLGYQCISREILLEASEHFNIPEIKLERALHDAPSVLQRFTYGKERYLAYISAAFLERIQQDNVVYHGLAGQFLMRGVAHVLKVRILSEIDDRVDLEMELDKKVNRREALARLLKDDEERRQWSLHLFGEDTWNPGLYDMVLHIHKLNVQNVVDLICSAAKLEQFQATTKSQTALNNLLLASRVRARLVGDYPMVQTHAIDGIVTVDARLNAANESTLADRIREMAQEVSGVKEVRMHTLPISAYARGDLCDE